MQTQYGEQKPPVVNRIRAMSINAQPITCVMLALLAAIGLGTSAVSQETPVNQPPEVRERSILDMFREVQSRLPNALRGDDPEARDAAIEEFVRRQETIEPFDFLHVVAGLMNADRSEDARTWYLRGYVRIAVDTRAEELAGGAYWEPVGIYQFSARSIEGFERFLLEEREAYESALDLAFQWDEDTPRRYAPFGGDFADGVERGSLLTNARAWLRAQVEQRRRATGLDAASLEARRAAAEDGVIAREARRQSDAPLDAAFSAVAIPVSTINVYGPTDQNQEEGCTPARGQPLAGDGASILVACPDIRRVALQDGAVMETWSVDDLQAQLGCPTNAHGNWFADNTEVVVDGLSATILFSCPRRQGPQDVGAAFRSQFLISVDGQPFEPLIVDADWARVEQSNINQARLAEFSEGGRYLFLVGGAPRIGVFVDLESRRVVEFIDPRAVRTVDDTSVFGTFGRPMLTNDPLAVVFITARADPNDPNYTLSPDTVVVWSQDEPLRGIEFPHRIEPNGRTAGLIALRVRPSTWDPSYQPAPPTGIDAFSSAGIDLPAGDLTPDGTGPDHTEASMTTVWFDPTDLWVGADDDAIARAVPEDAAVYCDVTGDELGATISLYREGSLSPIGARTFPGHRPTWCEIDSGAGVLVIGVGEYAHVYRLDVGR